MICFGSKDFTDNVVYTLSQTRHEKNDEKTISLCNTFCAVIVSSYHFIKDKNEHYFYKCYYEYYFLFLTFFSFMFRSPSYTPPWLFPPSNWNKELRVLLANSLYFSFVFPSYFFFYYYLYLNKKHDMDQG